MPQHSVEGATGMRHCYSYDCRETLPVSAREREREEINWQGKFSIAGHKSIVGEEKGCHSRRRSPASEGRKAWHFTVASFNAAACLGGIQRAGNIDCLCHQQQSVYPAELQSPHSFSANPPSALTARDLQQKCPHYSARLPPVSRPSLFTFLSLMNTLATGLSTSI